MEERQSLILSKLIAEYIATAYPVSSAVIAQRLRQAVSPATVRTILGELDEEGYVSQPHTSAGRVPTDRGYRYYVDSAPAAGAPPLALRALKARLHAALSEQPVLVLREAIHVLTRATGTIAVSVVVESREVVHGGVHELLQQPEGEDLKTLREATDIMQRVDEYTDALDTNEDEVSIYIGHENPFYPAQYTSVVVRPATTRNHKHVMFVIVGPKRMPYHRHVDVLNSVAEHFRELNV